MSKSQNITVTFRKGDTVWTASVTQGDSLLDAARQCGAPVHTLCNGIGACVQCKVQVVDQDDCLTVPNALEKDRLGNIFHLTHERLACQCSVLDSVTVVPIEPRLPKRSRAKKRRSSPQG